MRLDVSPVSRDEGEVREVGVGEGKVLVGTTLHPPQTSAGKSSEGN